MNAPDRQLSVELPIRGRNQDTGEVTYERKVEMTKDTKQTNAATFVVRCEDHTVGHLLRMELLRDPAVRFAAYRHPHPLDQHIELKVQVAQGTSHGAANSPVGAVKDAAARLAAEFIELQAALREQLQQIREKHAAEADRELS